MQVVIHPSDIAGTIAAPPSKSAMQRACAAALLRTGISTLINPGNSNDDQAALSVIAALGAEVVHMPNGNITIHSKGIQPTLQTINCGESGLGLRMFTPIAALCPQPISISGHGSLLHRPIDFFATTLPLLGIDVNTTEGRLPLQLQGPLMPADISIDGSLSSQFLTGLLMAYSVAVATEVTITVHQLASKPYIDLTLQLMRHFGLNTPVNNNYEQFIFTPQTSQVSAPVRYVVEGDWSSAAFLLVAAAVAGEVTITGLNIYSVQADRAILTALKKAGCKPTTNKDTVTVKGGPLKAFHFDATDCPDLFPPLVALAANANGTSIITGVNRLQHKESNRGLTLQTEFAKMGIAITILGNKMLVTGDRIMSATVNAHNDHRIAMACAVAALNADAPVTIEGAASVNKSYPAFFEDLRKLQTIA